MIRILDIQARGQWLTAAASVLLAVGSSAAPAEGANALPNQAPTPLVLRHVLEQVLPSGWIVDESENVCGVRASRQITNPASVRYDEVLEATPEVQRMKREGISRESAQGQVLHAAAVDRVSKAARRVMGSRSHCSVWKQIRHSDGRMAPDISAEVKAEL